MTSGEAPVRQPVSLARSALVIATASATSRAVVNALRAAGFEVEQSGSERGTERATPPTALLIEAAGGTGPIEQLVRCTRQRPSWAPVAIVVVGAGNPEIAPLLRAGADDCVGADVAPEDIALRVVARLERLDALREAALRDSVTGLPGHRMFSDRLHDEVARYRRYRSPFALAVFEVRGLDEVRAALGLDEMNGLVSQLAGELRRNLRGSDVLGRLGAGEFGLLLPHTPQKGAWTLIERVRTAWPDQTVGGVELRLVAGIATCPGAGLGSAELLSAARSAVRQAESAASGMAAATSEPTDAGSPVDEEMLLLRQAFRRDLDDQAKRLSGWRTLPLPERAQSLSRLAHFFAGTATAGGFPTLCEFGAGVERWLGDWSKDASPEDDAGLVDQIGSTMEAILRQIETGDLDETMLDRIAGQLDGEDGAQEEGEAETVDILVVDDEHTSHVAIESSLLRAGFSLRRAYSGAEALHSIEERSPDLIILDVLLPDINGYDLLSRIRAEEKMQLVPILFVTSRQQLNDKIRALRRGADDYLTKPFSPEELVARVGARLERARVSRDLAMKDALTGLYNHGFFQTRMNEELRRAQRYGSPLSVALLDIDDFKKINDTHGHQVGDAALAALAGQLLEGLRSTDVVARYGGEEFAIILPETPLHHAVESLDRIRRKVAETELVSLPGRTEGLRITFTAGLAEAHGHDEKEPLIAQADAALYRGKNGGKNRVYFAG